MYELIQVTESAYYLDCPSKIGIVKVGEDEVVLIDSGKDRSAAKRRGRCWTGKAGDFVPYITPTLTQTISAAINTS